MNVTKVKYVTTVNVVKAVDLMLIVISLQLVLIPNVPIRVITDNVVIMAFAIQSITMLFVDVLKVSSETHTNLVL